MGTNLTGSQPGFTQDIATARIATAHIKTSQFYQITYIFPKVFRQMQVFSIFLGGGVGVGWGESNSVF